MCIDNNQDQLRSESNIGVVGALGADNYHNIGRIIIVPATIIGSSRYTKQRLQDSMAFLNMGHIHINDLDIFKMPCLSLSKIWNILRQPSHLDDLLILTNISFKDHLLMSEMVLARLSTIELMEYVV
jgi:hypothetical protein